MAETKKIPLNGGGYATVDAAVYDAVKGKEWARVENEGSKTAYASSHITDDEGNSHKIYLHSVVMGLGPHSGYMVDHKNRDGLDCRRENLRIVTQTQNMMNLPTREDSSSGYRGVRKHHTGKWQAKIDVEGHRVNLGLYPTTAMAAFAYNTASQRLHGTYGSRNEIPVGELSSRQRHQIRRKVLRTLEDL